MGLTFDQLFPGRFIKAGEMHGKDVTLTIKTVYRDMLEGNDGIEKAQAIISLVETPREWALNKTNALRLRAMFGDDTDAWVGRRVTLFPEPDSSGMSDSGFCLRVKGSPDIDKSITYKETLARKRPRDVTLQKTKAGKAEGFDAETGEVAPDVVPDEPTDEELALMFGEDKGA